MPLLSLPAELLLQVFQIVGAEYFRQDLRRLTICKQWYAFALPACWADLALSQKTLRRLMSAPHAQQSLNVLNETVESLRLDLTGIEDPELQDAIERSSWETDWEECYLAVRRSCTDRLNQELVALAAMRKVRVLRIGAAKEEAIGEEEAPEYSYLFLSTVQSFLETRTLTVLDLDLYGSRLLQQEDCENDHICTRIGALLCTLTCLRLRMRSICPIALTPPSNDTNLRLRQLAINLSLYNPARTRTTSHSMRCGVRRGYILQLKIDMRRQAETLATYMASPKTVRIFTHTLPNFQFESLDVVTGKQMKLANDMAWEVDGETLVDEYHSNPETEISSLSSDASDSSNSSSSDSGL